VLDAYDALAEGESNPVSIDEIVNSSGLAASQVLATIGVLEMRRLIRRLPGNQSARAELPRNILPTRPLKAGRGMFEQ
jgi:predicted Rossmann fold nucleotide-binding protein DprA/Smf involved in DNA uptake